MVWRAGRAVERAVHRPFEALQDGAAVAGGALAARNLGNGEADSGIAGSKGGAELQAARLEHAEAAPLSVAWLHELRDEHPGGWIALGAHDARVAVGKECLARARALEDDG